MTITVGNVEIRIRTRDEHCPPHVHAHCGPERWSARFKFSFVSDDVEFWDFQPDNPKKLPSRSQLDEVGHAIFADLAHMRRRWWEVMGTVCLENQSVRVDATGLHVVEDRRFAKGLPRVLIADYHPATHILSVRLSDGTEHQQEL